MKVIAVSTPRRPDWRWRIVDYDGNIIEESYEEFPTIAAAVAHGTQRVGQINGVDTSPTIRPPRWISRGTRDGGQR